MAFERAKEVMVKLENRKGIIQCSKRIPDALKKDLIEEIQSQIDYINLVSKMTPAEYQIFKKRAAEAEEEHERQQAEAKQKQEDLS